MFIQYNDGSDTTVESIIINITIIDDDYCLRDKEFIFTIGECTVDNFVTKIKKYWLVMGVLVYIPGYN